MKHPHAVLIKQWLEDTTQEIEYNQNNKTYKGCPQLLINDKLGEYNLYIVKKPDEYEHLRRAIRDGKKIEYLKNDGKWEICNSNAEFYEDKDRYRIHDPYRELKEAQASGKRVVFQMSNGEYIDINDEEIGTSFSPERYKIVEHDIIEHAEIMPSPNFKLGNVKIKLTKSGITGKITAEIINE